MIALLLTVIVGLAGQSDGDVRLAAKDAKAGGNVEEAVRLLDAQTQRLALDPQADAFMFADTLRMLGQYRRDEADPRPAIEAYEALIAFLESRDLGSARGFAELYRMGGSALAALYSAQARHDEAQAVLRKVAALPADMVAAESGLSASLQLARSQATAGQRLDAAATIRAALEANPTYGIEDGSRWALRYEAATFAARGDRVAFAAELTGLLDEPGCRTSSVGVGIASVLARELIALDRIDRVAEAIENADAAIAASDELRRDPYVVAQQQSMVEALFWHHITNNDLGAAVERYIEHVARFGGGDSSDTMLRSIEEHLAP